jgi:hypothetical protein
VALSLVTEQSQHVISSIRTPFRFRILLLLGESEVF